MTRTAGLVLAGGGSRRFGSDKSAAVLAGDTLLDLTLARAQPQVDFLVLSGSSVWREAANLPLIMDEEAGQGPIAGILAGLQWAAAHDCTHVATFPSDVPFFPLDLVGRLSNALLGDLCCTMATSRGAKHPVFGLWNVQWREDLARIYRTGVRSLHRTSELLACRFVDFPPDAAAPGGDPFFNINRPEDLAAAESWLQRT